MAHPANGLLRVLRAALLGSVAFTLAMSAHVVAGGRTPSMAISVVLAIACVGVCLVLTARRLGVVAIATALGALQLGLHYAFMWLPSSGCVADSPTAMALTRVHGAPAQMLACEPMASGHVASMAQLPTMLMLGAHAVATLATALFLARGERVLWLLVSAAWTVFHSVGPVLILPAGRRCQPALTGGVGHALVALGGIGRRGPPALRLLV
jgi:hypothetical protein